MSSFEEHLVSGLYSGFLDRRRPSQEAMRPKLVLNDRLKQSRVADVLNTHLHACSSFSFSVAFLRQGDSQPSFKRSLNANEGE